MGGLMSRNKGQRAEREVVKLLQPVVDGVFGEAGMQPPVLERNLMQSKNGGFDIVGLEWLALEVKHQEGNGLTSWWDQCKRQAREGQEPVLFYRRNHAPWRIRMFGHLVAGGRRVRCPVDIDLPSFYAYLRIRLKAELGK